MVLYKVFEESVVYAAIRILICEACVICGRASL
jgi:hypothetical protein